VTGNSSRSLAIFEEVLQLLISYTKFEVLAAVSILIVILWAVTPCILVSSYQHFKGK
jgi:hypothetical protein